MGRNRATELLYVAGLISILFSASGCETHLCGGTGQPCCEDRCADGLTCLLNTCVLPNKGFSLGATCEAHSDCTSTACLDGICVARCFADDDCVPGWKCLGTEEARTCTCLGPSTEVCDGLDNNCDGRPDDAAAEEACLSANPATHCRDSACRCDGTMCGSECVDLDVAPSHCGGCNVVCLAATPVCSIGTCVRRSDVPTGDVPHGLDSGAIRDGVLYGGSWEGIWSYSPATSETTLITPANILRFAASDTDLYWNTDANILTTQPLLGGAPQTIALIETFISGALITDADTVYWQDTAGLWSYSPGGSPKSLPVSTGMLMGAGPEHSLWLFGTGFVRWPLDGGEAATISAETCGYSFVSDTRLYCQLLSGVNFDSIPGAIVQPQEGGSPVTLVRQSEEPGIPIAATGDYLYWARPALASTLPVSRILRRRMPDGRIETVAAGLPLVNGLWVSDDTIVWSSFDQSTQTWGLSGISRR